MKASASTPAPWSRGGTAPGTRPTSIRVRGWAPGAGAGWRLGPLHPGVQVGVGVGVKGEAIALLPSWGGFGDEGGGHGAAAIRPFGTPTPHSYRLHGAPNCGMPPAACGSSCTPVHSASCSLAPRLFCTEEHDGSSAMAPVPPTPTARLQCCTAASAPEPCAPPPHPPTPSPPLPPYSAALRRRPQYPVRCDMPVRERPRGTSLAPHPRDRSAAAAAAAAAASWACLIHSWRRGPTPHPVPCLCCCCWRSER